MPLDGLQNKFLFLFLERVGTVEIEVIGIYIIWHPGHHLSLLFGVCFVTSSTTRVANAFGPTNAA